MATTPYHIDLSPEQFLLLKDVAARSGKTQQEVLEAALRQYLVAPIAAETEKVQSSEESVFDALLREGLVGCVDNCPSDLSTNPKYLEGIGRSDW